jgi:hypothetical protein
MNVDAFSQLLGKTPSDIGFDASYSQQLHFNRFLAQTAHDRGLAVGLHNDGGQVKLDDHIPAVMALTIQPNVQGTLCA